MKPIARTRLLLGIFGPGTDIWHAVARVPEHCIHTFLLLWSCSSALALRVEYNGVERVPLRAKAASDQV